MNAYISGTKSIEQCTNELHNLKRNNFLLFSGPGHILHTRPLISRFMSASLCFNKYYGYKSSRLVLPAVIAKAILV